MEGIFGTLQDNFIVVFSLLAILGINTALAKYGIKSWIVYSMINIILIIALFTVGFFSGKMMTLFIVLLTILAMLFLSLKNNENGNV